MIIGRTQSADGGFRRIPIRHTQIVDEANLKPFVEDVNSTSYADPTNTKAMNEKRLAMLHDRLEQGQISFNEFNEKARKINNNNDN